MKASDYFRETENLPEFVYDDEGAIRNSFKEYHDFSTEFDNHCNKIEEFSNKRVIEELYEALCDNPVDMVSHLKNIIKELKTIECK